MTYKIEVNKYRIASLRVCRVESTLYRDGVEWKNHIDVSDSELSRNRTAIGEAEEYLYSQATQFARKEFDGCVPEYTTTTKVSMARVRREEQKEYRPWDGRRELDLPG